ncbi:Hypothetical predicted protein [Cloeon dipterum]|uniref:EF-hand domain-containing protein n=1 Tax=Cloeon dipterum TaxID=197152 RepID=A0A8S1DL05_9INSE|nr:Hypothetical predicted protein [Cloeon dipterum]
MRALAWPAARRPPSSGPSHSLSRTPMVEDGVCTTEDELNSSGSELDEAEQRRELLTDKWRQLFDKYDPEGFGEIPWDDFVVALHSPDFVSQVEPNKREILAEKAQQRLTSAITFQDFVNVVQVACDYFIWIVARFAHRQPLDAASRVRRRVPKYVLLSQYSREEIYSYPFSAKLAHRVVI